jgi:hypothetical protein
MAVVANEDGELVMQDPLSQESGIVAETGEEVDEVEEDIEMQELKIESITSSSPKSSTQNTQSDPKLQKEMETCFGFDEEEEEEDESGNINMLQTIL